MQESLICNIKTCQNILKEQSKIYSCGHAVCQSHSPLQADSCPVCLRPSEYISVNMNQNFESSQRSINLLCYSHKEILSSFSCALDYWFFQQSFTFHKVLSEKEAKIKSLEEKLKVSKDENLELSRKLEEKKEIFRPLETPVIFCPPSNKKFKQITLEEYNKHKN